MSNDDTRGNESPDRRDDSQTDYRPILEQLDTNTTDLLEAITDDETLDSNDRLTAKRHCRELRAELECLGRHLLESDDWRVPATADREVGITTVDDPIEAALERAQWNDYETEYEYREHDARSDEEDESDD